MDEEKLKMILSVSSRALRYDKKQQRWFVTKYTAISGKTILEGASLHELCLTKSDKK